MFSSLSSSVHLEIIISAATPNIDGPLEFRCQEPYDTSIPNLLEKCTKGSPV